LQELAPTSARRSGWGEAGTQGGKSPHATHPAEKSGKAFKAKSTEGREERQAAAQVQRLMHPRAEGS
jgi:hypothetical protein